MTTETRRGERLGRYELLEVIASAATCDMYLATDRANGQTVEIKVLNERHLSAPEAVQRLVHGANLARKLDHPALARVIAVDADYQGVPFVVEEHLHGELLGRQIDASVMGIPLERVVGILAPIVEALAGCHEVGLIHGCIDRHHVVMTDEIGAPPAKLIRFDARDEARSSQLAPELRGTDRIADTRSDVWAIAALLHEMLWGTAPAAGSGAVCLPAHAPGLPEELSALLGRCLAVTPEARPENACALRDTLLRLRSKRGARRARVESEETRRAVGPSSESAMLDPAVVSAVACEALESQPPTAHGAETTDLQAAPVARAIDREASTQALVSTSHTLTEFAPGRRAKRQRRVLTEPEFGARARRAQRRAAKALASRAVADLPARAATEAADSAVQPRPSGPPQSIAATSTAQALAPVPATPPTYQLPERSLLDLRSKIVGGAAHVAPEAVAPLQLTPSIADPIPTALPIPTSSKRRARPKDAGKVRFLRVKAGGKATKGRANSKAMGAPANGPSSTAEQALRVVGGEEDVAVVHGETPARIASAQGELVQLRPLVDRPLVDRPLVDRPLADRPLADRPRDDRPLVDRPLDDRPRLGERRAQVTDAIRRLGEHNTRREQRAELITLLLCTPSVFAVPLLCGPIHTPSEQTLGARVLIGFGVAAASTFLALVQLWWLQLSTRQPALWPATTALKGVTLLVCFLTVTHFLPAGTVGTLEATARSLLPWTAGAFYLSLGVYGLSRTQYNISQHALLGGTLVVMYGGSVIGALRMVHASVTAAPQVAAGSDSQRRRELASSLERLARSPRPSAQLGAANSTTLETELEALGDTTGAPGTDAPPTADGSENPDQSGEQIRRTRTERAARLEALQKQLKSLKR